MKTPTPFCCDITSGSVEERNEFIRLLNKKEGRDCFVGENQYYGVRAYGKILGITFTTNPVDNAIKYFTRIIPLSEGIAILKEMVGEGPKTKVNEHSLLPCPFCGGDCEVGMNGLSQYVVKCYPCSVSMSDDRKDKVVTNWNNRQPKP